MSSKDLIKKIDLYANKFLEHRDLEALCKALEDKYPNLKKRYIARLVKEITKWTAASFGYSTLNSLNDVVDTINNLRGIANESFSSPAEIKILSMARHQNENILSLYFAYKATNDEYLEFIAEKISKRVSLEEVKPYIPLIREIIKVQVQMVTNSIQNVLPISEEPRETSDQTLSQQPPQPVPHSSAKENKESINTGTQMTAHTYRKHHKRKF